MKREPPKPDVAKSMAMLDAAILDGTHSRGSRHVCGGCRRWVDGIYYVSFDGTPLCGACADNIGQGPKADELRLRGKGARS